MNNAQRLLVSMIDELGRVTDEPGRLTRTFLSPAMENAVKLVGSWMQDAGCRVRIDKCGNLIGSLRGSRPRARTLLLGSHLDTVRNAGRFDGALGVLLPIVALYELNNRGMKLPFNVELLGFSEEEGVRFSSGYLGSEFYCGRIDRRTLALTDANGITVRQAIEAFGGKFRMPRPAHKREELIGYLEVHIEQGPVLESAGLATGVVPGIVGQSRFKVDWNGRAGHAGTTPMRLRRDALTGAAEFAVALERFARRTPGLVATIGTFEVPGGASNVIPGQVRHTLDVRHAKDGVRRNSLREIRMLATTIATRRSLRCAWTTTQDDPAVACSPALTERLAESVRRVQGRSIEVPSGAGHDGVVISSLAPVAMLFVRSRGGLSHHPDEFTTPADLEVALDVLIDFLAELARRES